MSYVGVPPFGQTVQTVTEKIATAGQTTFSPDGGYLPGYVDVLINGTELASSDYTATNGTTIILNTACAAGEEFKAKARWPVSMVDTYRKGETDTLLAGKLATTAGAVGTTNLAANAVTYAKMQQVSAGKVLGRNTSGAGDVQELPIAVDANGNVFINTNSATYGERFSVYSNNTQNAIAANLGASASGCTALLATSQAGVTGSDLIGGWHANVNQFRVNTAGVMMFNSGFGSSATAYGCRAWLNFNGQGTVAILGSGNISSLTRVATGCFDIGMSSAMPDSNYSIGGSVQNGSFGIAMMMGLENYDYGRVKTTTSLRIYTRHDGYIRVDSPDVSVNIFR